MALTFTSDLKYSLGHGDFFRKQCSNSYSERKLNLLPGQCVILSFPAASLGLETGTLCKIQCLETLEKRVRRNTTVYFCHYKKFTHSAWLRGWAKIMFQVEHLRTKGKW